MPMKYQDANEENHRKSILTTLLILYSQFMFNGRNGNQVLASPTEDKPIKEVLN